MTLRYISPIRDSQISLVINVYFLIYFFVYLESGGGFKIWIELYLHGLNHHGDLFHSNHRLPHTFGPDIHWGHNWAEYVFSLLQATFTSMIFFRGLIGIEWGHHPPYHIVLQDFLATIWQILGNEFMNSFHKLFLKRFVTHIFEHIEHRWEPWSIKYILQSHNVRIFSRKILPSPLRLLALYWTVLSMTALCAYLFLGNILPRKDSF